MLVKLAGEYVGWIGGGIEVMHSTAAAVYVVKGNGPTLIDS